MALERTGLTDAIDKAFAIEWKAAKQTEVPGAGAADRRLMFAAVARGLLQYLADHQATFITRVTLTTDESGTAVTYDVRDTALDLQGG